MVSLTYLLDTDTLVDFLRGVPAAVQGVLQRPAADLCTSAVNLAELYYGASKSSRAPERLREVRALEQRLEIVPLSRPAAAVFGGLKADLERAGQRLDDADLWIASVALERGLVLVTHNAKHFLRIPSLRLEDWLS